MPDHTSHYHSPSHYHSMHSLRTLIHFTAKHIHNTLLHTLQFSTTFKATCTTLTMVSQMSIKRGIPPQFIANILQQVTRVEVASSGYYTVNPPGMHTNHAHPQGHQQALLSQPLGIPSPQTQHTPITPSTDHIISTPSLPPISLQDITPFHIDNSALTSAMPIPRPPMSTTPPLAFKPLGKVGAVNIPPDLIKQLNPHYNPTVLSRQNITPFKLPTIPPYDPSLNALITSLLPQMLITEIPHDQLSNSPMYHCNAFTIPKPSSNKLSLILNLKQFNQSQSFLPPPVIFHRSTPCVQHYSKPTASTHNCFSASGIYRTFIGACEDHGGSSFPRLNLTNPSSSTPCQFYRLGGTRLRG